MVSVLLRPGAHVQHGVGAAICHHHMTVIPSGVEPQITFFFNGFEHLKGLAIQDHEPAVMG